MQRKSGFSGFWEMRLSGKLRASRSWPPAFLSAAAPKDTLALISHRSNCSNLICSRFFSQHGINPMVAPLPAGACIYPAISGIAPSGACTRHRNCPASAQWPPAGAGCSDRRAGPDRNPCVMVKTSMHRIELLSFLKKIFAEKA